jgi:hypothetical protein
MFLASLIWLQSQPLSKTVIFFAALFFILAISLLVYFVRKLRSGGKTEEDWSLTRSSLFVEPPSGPSVIDVTQAPEAAALEPDAATGRTRLLASEMRDAEARATDDLPSASPTGPRTAEMAAPPLPREAPPATESLTSPPAAPPEPRARDERRTQLFSSPPPPTEERASQVLTSYPTAPVTPPEEEAVAPATEEAVPFDEDVWAGLDEVQTPAAIEAAPELPAPSEPPAPPVRTVEPPSARIAERPPRAPFERPTVEPLRQPRAPFEPPTIIPITPREQTALLGARPDLAAGMRDRRSSDEPSRPEKPAAAESNLYHEPTGPAPTAPLYSDSASRRDRTAEMASLTALEAGESAASLRSAHRPAGAVLGLPVEASQSPLVLGTPVKSREEIGIGSLTGYGRVDKEGGRGGLIALAVALILFGGAALAYFLVPSVHDRVNAWVARSRGLDSNEANSSQPKVMIFPSRTPETDKNTVHAKGAVQNISNDTLENLALEVQLNKSGGETETVSVPVTPAQLAPNDQGAYAFDYDGKSVISYTIKHLTSNGKEMRFTAPGQK